MDISVLGFCGYIGDISNIRDISEIYLWIFLHEYHISEINKNTLKFMEILCKITKMTLIIKYTH